MQAIVRLSEPQQARIVFNESTGEIVDMGVIIVVGVIEVSMVTITFFVETDYPEATNPQCSGAVLEHAGDQCELGTVTFVQGLGTTALIVGAGQHRLKSL